MKNSEIRVGIPVEFRADEDGTVRVSGYAAVFNQRADIGGWFTEEFAPGAFSEAINRDDVVFLVNHSGLPLARTRSKTLTLKEDDHGLKIETRLDPNDPDVAQIVPKMERGDLDKMSIAFYAERQEWDETGEIPHRMIHQARLDDVSIVTRPAYDGTEIGLRSLKDWQAERKRQNYDAATRRLRAKKLRETDLSRT